MLPNVTEGSLTMVHVRMPSSLPLQSSGVRAYALGPVFLYFHGEASDAQDSQGPGQPAASYPELRVHFSVLHHRSQTQKCEERIQNVG